MRSIGVKAAELALSRWSSDAVAASRRGRHDEGLRVFAKDTLGVQVVAVAGREACGFERSEEPSLEGVWVSLQCACNPRLKSCMVLGYANALV